MKANNHIANEGTFRTHQAFSPEEILAAGGATAFGLKSGKNNEQLIKVLNETPAVEPFTEKEWNDLVSQISNDK